MPGTLLSASLGNSPYEVELLFFTFTSETQRPGTRPLTPHPRLPNTLSWVVGLPIPCQKKDEWATLSKGKKVNLPMTTVPTDQ